MRFLFFMLLLGLPTVAYCEEETKELPPINPAYNAEHAMALVNQGSRIFAVNLPTYKQPHDVQIVYKIENPDVAFLNVVRGAELITIKPKPFNIQRLIRDEEITITADVYNGDYRRDGILVYKNRTIEMSKRLYARELNYLAESSQWQDYDLITLKENERIYIHKISQAPSYNHLIYVDLTSACLQKFRTSKRVPKESELTYKFINCGTLKPLYFDSEDLQLEN
ncbi:MULTISPECIES: hypothetical protein [unclassified Pseudoalteromonas]|uniref:hypothetical protein n=1 Tax=unclassified Pseudoalteromonas TaxID=194690 RepID=UPI0025B62409|nr:MULTISPECIES: hypothetical protein [unclassified Pseudoalteromonas]MDN3379228.1 hypothetical protein [Pseudoalteromonas sp. APC 3893]MDN3386402.1 hypothetical protein [Pseudoalteromonas sp. APC 4017]